METVKPFELRKIGHVVLNVTDLEASLRFYTGVLGLLVSDRNEEDTHALDADRTRAAHDLHGG